MQTPELFTCIFCTYEPLYTQKMHFGSCKWIYEFKRSIASWSSYLVACFDCLYISLVITSKQQLVTQLGKGLKILQFWSSNVELQQQQVLPACQHLLSQTWISNYGFELYPSWILPFLLLSWVRQLFYPECVNLLNELEPVQWSLARVFSTVAGNQHPSNSHRAEFWPDLKPNILPQITC